MFVSTGYPQAGDDAKVKCYIDLNHVSVLRANNVGKESESYEVRVDGGWISVEKTLFDNLAANKC